MADEGAILAPTCEEMAQDLKHERERLSRSIEQLQAAHALLGSIIHAGIDHRPGPPQRIGTRFHSGRLHNPDGVI